MQNRIITNEMKFFSIAVLFLGPLFSPFTSTAFDTGHHWECSSQVLRELGFSDDARQTVCVSNWLLDYYSSSPTASKKVREDLSKLHCDNLGDASAVKRYLDRFLFNSREAVADQMQRQNLSSDRELLLLIGAILHVTQDLYSHSNWPELYSGKNRLTDTTWFKTRGAVPRGLITGAYHPPHYVSNQIPDDHPDHGSYEGGIHKDSHDRENWAQAYYLAYCATREMMEGIRSWIPEERWHRLQTLNLGPLAQAELNREVKAAYGISQWIDVGGEHGHWKGGKSGDKSRFLKSAIQFIGGVSRNSRWYRMKHGFEPLLPGLYEMKNDHVVGIPKGIDLPRKTFKLEVEGAREIGDHLDKGVFGAPDFYLMGAVYYGRVVSPTGLKEERTLYGKLEPSPPVQGEICSLYRDRVQQEQSVLSNPWRTLIIADAKRLRDAGGVLSIYFNVGEEDPGPDDLADLSPNPRERGLLIEYHPASGRIVIPGNDTSFNAGRENITVSGDDPRRSVEMTFSIKEWRN